MKFFDFFKRRNVVINKVNEKEEAVKPKVIKLSKSILDKLSVYEIIYAELAEGGAMGCAGQIMFYVINEGELAHYETNLFKDERTYMQIQEILFKQSGFKEFPLFGNVDKQTDSSKNQFNYYYGGVGNHVLVNKNISLEVIDEHFVYKNNNKEYHIYSSVLGVFNSVAYAMQNSENEKK